LQTSTISSKFNQKYFETVVSLMKQMQNTSNSNFYSRFPPKSKLFCDMFSQKGLFIFNQNVVGHQDVANGSKASQNILK